MSKTNNSRRLDPIEALRTIDLNLLVALDALISECHVTRAAGRIGVTQSAMSHTLRRLRGVLDDALLVRGRHGMRLTPRAESLRIPVRSGLVTLGHALTRAPTFEPATDQRRFRLATPDLFDAVALPGLLTRLRLEAPGIDLTVVTAMRQGLAEALETGEVSAAVIAVPADADPGAFPALPAGGLRERTLFRDSFSCFLRRDHPRLTQPGPTLSLDAFASAPHVLVSPRGTGPGLVDRYLHDAGRARRVALRVPYFASAPAIIAQSDLVLTAPTSLAQMLPPDSPLVVIKPPVPIPDHRVVLTWHHRLDDDPANRWLRDLVVAVAKPLGIRPSPCVL